MNQIIPLHQESYYWIIERARASASAANWVKWSRKGEMEMFLEFVSLACATDGWTGAWLKCTASEKQDGGPRGYISLWKEGNSFEVKVKDRTDPLTTRANNAEERAARATQRGRSVSALGLCLDYSMNFCLISFGPTKTAKHVANFARLAPLLRLFCRNLRQFVYERWCLKQGNYSRIY